MRVLLVSVAVALCSCGTPSQPDVSDGAGDVAVDTGSDDSPDVVDVFDASIDVARDVTDAMPDTSGCDMDHDSHRAMSCGGDDCNDSDPNVFPGAPEYCDGVDQNCDGVADQMPDGGTDPAADTECDAGSFQTQIGMNPPFSNDSPVRCYMIPTPSSAPCQIPSSPIRGMCEGCWHDITVPRTCWTWTDIPGTFTGGTCH